MHLLEEWIKSKKLTYPKAASACYISRTTLYYALKGRPIKRRTVKKILKGTRGVIDLSDQIGKEIFN